MANPDDVLRFWFGDGDDEREVIARGRPRWFNGGEALDREIGERFGERVEAARRGGLADWAGDAHGRLALLVLIDQFGRHLHRGEGVAFAADGLAQSLCLEGLRLGHDRQLGRPQRVFFYLPLEHAENPALQDCSVALFAALRDEAPADLRAHYEGFLDYAVRHREVIARFGRFPHRNAALGRANTPDEEACLALPGAGF